MLTIIADTLRLAAFGSQWDAPEHWRKRGPRSDWEVANDEWERNRRLYQHPSIR